ncbi:MAG: DNA double-strand break repair nuclease NurA [Promethearchaeota archaeon]
MPEFLIEFIKDLKKKSKKILESFEDKEINKFYEKKFNSYWIAYQIKSCAPDQDVIAIDSSRGRCPTSNGGFFFVCRALALGNDYKYRTISTDFDFSNINTQSIYIGRVMEWTEHLAGIQAIEKNFEGILLIDGSLYGRMAHLPLELKLENNKGFILEYFEAYLKILKLCKEKGILLIGISKESRTSFFREFLIKELLKEKISDKKVRKRLLSEALDQPKKALKLAKSLGDDVIVLLTEELIARKPDSLLILNNAKNSGYTKPLLLGASARWRRAERLIRTNFRQYVESNFPTLSENPEFIKHAQKIIFEMLDFPAIVSLHILPTRIDTPIRIDIPAWYFNIDKRLLDIGWPKTIDVDLDEVLKLISAGYCGLENYNIWLTSVDNEVKLSRVDFEELYLKKFEEIIGKKATPRGYRRVKYP